MKGLLKLVRALAGIAAVAAVVFLIWYFVTHSKPVIYDLRAYVEHTVTGYNGEAVMDVSVNKNNLAEDILPQLKKKDREAYQELSDAINSGRSSDFIDNLFVMKVSDVDHLSNGDTVRVNFVYDNEFLASYGVEFTGDSVDIPVEGLKDIVKVDYLKDITLSYAGISPYLTTDERIFTQLDDAYVVCTVTPADHLKSGDKVTVSIDMEESEFPEGTRPLREEAEFVVDEADAFVMKLSDLQEEDLKRIKKQCKKSLDEFSGVKVSDEMILFTDDGELDGTEVIGKTTPNLLAAVFTCDPPPEASAGPEEGDEVTDSGTVSENPDEEDTGAEDEKLYGVVLMENLTRTLDGNLTFQISSRNVAEDAFQLYSSEDDLKSALKKYVKNMKGALEPAL